MKSKKNAIGPDWELWMQGSKEREAKRKPQRELIQQKHDEVEAERKAFYARAQWQGIVNKRNMGQCGEVEEEIWERATGRRMGVAAAFYANDSIPNDHPLLTGFEEPGTIIQSAMMEDASDHLEHVLDRIREALEAAMKVELRHKARDLTPKQSAILILDNLYWDLKHSFRSCFFNCRTVGVALSFGAGVMRLAMKEPNGELAAKLDKLLGINFSKEAERGIERVIQKRNKKKQDRRKSAVESKRKESAIAMMKKLVPEHGQEKAAEKVLERMNRGRVEPLGVKAGTVRRWYNARLDEERKARKAAAEARLGRSPS